MEQVKITRWIDMNSPDFERIEKCNRIRRIVDVGVEAGIIVVDRAGFMFQNDSPVYAELDGGYVGLRYAAKASN